MVSSYIPVGGDAINVTQTVPSAKDQAPSRAQQITAQHARGIAYSPTASDRHINDYIIQNRLAELYGRLLPEEDIFRLHINSIGLNHGHWLREHCFSFIRLYVVPVEDEADIDDFHRVMQRFYQLYGTKIYLSDFLGLYDRTHAIDVSWLRLRIARLLELYAGEPWFMALSLGNENERFIRNGSANQVLVDLSEADYYSMMDDLAKYARRELARRQLVRPVFLGHGCPEETSWQYLSGLTSFDGLGLNLYVDPPALSTIFQQLDEMDRVRRTAGLRSLPIMVAEYGQTPEMITSMNDEQRAADFSAKNELLNKRRITGSVVFEMTDEAWKAKEEGPGAAHMGVIAKPEIERVFSCETRTPKKL